VSALRARIFALLTAIAVMLPGGAASPAHYFCRMAERVQAACCCAGAQDPHDSAPRTEVQPQDCCEKLAQPSRATASSADQPALDVPSPALGTLLPVDAWVGTAGGSSHVALRQARSPPSLGPPLFITHCSFLS